MVTNKRHRVLGSAPLITAQSPGIKTGTCVDGPHRARIFYDAEVRSVGCRHVSGLSRRRARPLALMRSANRVPINSAGSEARPRYRVSQSSVTTDLHKLRVT